MVLDLLSLTPTAFQNLLLQLLGQLVLGMPNCHLTGVELSHC